MTINQLRVFDAVCRHASITKASVALRISEPSVFQQVKSLEAWLGVKLYRKVGRVIQLTREGRAAQGDIEEVLAKLERLASKFKPSTTPSRLESLVIGGSRAPSAAFLPSLVGRFKQDHPHVQLVLRSKSSQTIERLILESEVEIALITRPSHSAGLHTLPYRFEKFVGFISAKHPLAKKAKLSMAEVEQCPLIVKSSDDSQSSSCLREMEAAGYRPNVLMRCESAEAIKLAVSNGMGLGFLYEDHVKSEIKKRDLKIVKIEGFNPPDVQSFIVFNKNHALSRNGEAFLSLLASAVDGSIAIEQFSVAADSKVA